MKIIFIIIPAFLLSLPIVCMEDCSQYDGSLKRDMLSILTSFDHASYDPAIIKKFRKIEYIYFKESPSKEEIDYFTSKLSKLAHRQQPFPPALFLLGIIRLHGWKSIEVDYDEGKKFLSRAAFYRYPLAEYELGLLYLIQSAEFRYFDQVKCQWWPAAHLLSLRWEFPSRDGMVSIFNTPASYFDHIKDNQQQLPAAFLAINEAFCSNDLTQAETLLQELMFKSSPSGLCMFIQDPSCPIVCSLAESGDIRFKKILGEFWEQVTLLDANDRAILFERMDIPVINQLEYAKEQTYNYFISAAQKGCCLSWIAIGKLIFSDLAPEYVKRQAAACFYKAFRLSENDNKTKKYALHHLLGIACLDGEELPDMQALARLILIAHHNDSIINNMTIKKIILKILMWQHKIKSEMIPALKNQLKEIIDKQNNPELFCLYGQILQQIGDPQGACSYFKISMNEYGEAAWLYVNALLDLNSVDMALEVLEEVCLKNKYQIADDQQQINHAILERLKRLSVKNARGALLLSTLYSDGIFLDHDEDAANRFLECAIQLKDPQALWLMIEQNQDKPSYEIIVDLLVLLDSDWQQDVIKKITTILENEDLPLSVYYDIINKTLDCDRELALLAFNKAEEFLAVHKDSLSDAESNLLYTSGAYDKLIEYAYRGNVKIWHALATMHVHHAEGVYGLKADIGTEWKRALTCYLNLPQDSLADVDSNKLKFQIITNDLDFNDNESINYILEMKVSYAPAQIAYILLRLNDKVCSDEEIMNLIEQVDASQDWQQFPEWKEYFSQAFFNICRYLFDQHEVEKSYLWCQWAIESDSSIARKFKEEIDEYTARVEANSVADDNEESVFTKVIQYYDAQEYDAALDLLDEIEQSDDYIRAGIYKGILYAAKKNIIFAVEEFEDVLESAIIEHYADYSDLISKAITALESLQDTFPEIGYFVARYQLLTMQITRNFEEIAHSIDRITNAEEISIKNVLMAENIVESGLYLTMQNMHRDNKADKASFFELLYLLLTIHVNRAFTNKLFLRTAEEHVQEARTICCQLEELAETDEQKKKLMDGFFDMAALASDTSYSLEEIAYLNKIISINRFHEDALFQRALLYLENPGQYGQPRNITNLAINDLKVLQKKNNTKAWIMLARIFIGEARGIRYEINPKTMQEGIKLMQKLADFDFIDDYVFQACIWYANCLIEGTHFKRNYKRAIEWLRAKTEGAPEYKEQMLVDLIRWAEKLSNMEEKKLLYKSIFEELEQIPHSSLETDLCAAKLDLTMDHDNKTAYNILEKYIIQSKIKQVVNLIHQLNILSDLEKRSKTDIKALFLLSRFWCLTMNNDLHAIAQAERFATQLYFNAKNCANTDDFYIFYSLVQMANMRTLPIRLDGASENKIYIEYKNALVRFKEILESFHQLNESQRVIFQTIYQRIEKDCASKISSIDYQNTIHQMISNELKPLLEIHQMAQR